MAELNDISIYKGEAVVLNFTMSPVTNITGWNIQLNVKLNQTDTTALLTVAGVITNAVQGQFSISLTHAQTNIRATTYYYDVQRIDSGSEAVLSIGAFSVLQEVKY